MIVFDDTIFQKRTKVRKFIEHFEIVSIENIKHHFKEYLNENEFEAIIEDLIKSGEIYSPKKGFYKKVSVGVA